MELDDVRCVISDLNLIDEQAIKSATLRDISKIVSEQKESGTNNLDLTNAETFIKVMSDVVSSSMTTTLQVAMPSAVAACITHMKDDLKREITQDVMQETREFVSVALAKVNEEFTRTNVRCSYNNDKQEAHSRRLNLSFSGIPYEETERSNQLTTADKIVAELSTIGCNISRDNISSCYRLYRRNATDNTTPPLILATFISQQVRDKVLSYSTRFKDSDSGKYMNEDMTRLQRKLFLYLRSKEEIVIKKTVSFKDGHIICLLKKNERKTRGWSRIHTALDLAELDDDLAVDFADEDILDSLGLKDYYVNINID